MRHLLTSFFLVFAFLSSPIVVALQPDAQPSAVPEILIVDINSASAEEIATKLVGVGLVKARAIIAYRDEFGPFRVLDQLTEVKGIGDRTLELNRDRLRLGNSESDD
ncbi:MAG: ComEA family DNA-binding protein [Gammaproteobacteria bacterium]|nr:ComEA family DNA-binding protein [Gammaproteobacteria bacterium]